MSSLTLNDKKALALYNNLDDDLKAKMNFKQYKMVIAKLIEEEKEKEKEKEKDEDEDEDKIEKDPNKLYIEYKKLNDALIVAKTEADLNARYNKMITKIKAKLSNEDKDMILAYYKAIYAIEEEKNDQVKLATELREALSLQLAKNAIYDKMITVINTKLSPEEKEIIFAYYENEYEEEYNDNDNENDNDNDYDYDELTLTNIEIMETKVKIIAWLINID
jgi:hypothetical protein